MSALFRGAAIIVAVLCTGALAIGTDEKPKDLDQLQGTWAAPTNDGGENRFVFLGDMLTSTVNGQKYISKIKLDTEAKPRTIDFMVKEGPNDTAGSTVLGIYELEGDTLKLCISLPGINTRPTEFKRTEDETVVFQLKRMKE
jgi:uncharacterized protein (TIGR03067 family)